MIKKAMIMAAGAGTRLNPLTQKLPKPMIPVVNTPILEFILKHIKKYNINDVIANTHYIADPIHEAFGGKNHLDINFTYVYEPELSGTAGGVKKTEFFFDRGETFLVVSGDALTDVDIEKLYNHHKSTGALATMALRKVPMEEVKHFGVVVTDENSRVVGFQEKPSIEEAKSNLVNTGIYIFEYEIFNYIPADTFYDFGKMVFPDMLEKGEPLYGCVIDDYWNDIGTINQYKLSSFDLLGKKLKYNGGQPIGAGTDIDDKAVLTGSNIIGKNCVIKSGAQLENCIVWDDTVVEGSYRDNIIANIAGKVHVL